MKALAAATLRAQRVIATDSRGNDQLFMRGVAHEFEAADMAAVTHAETRLGVERAMTNLRLARRTTPGHT